jgi:predicted component of type VI protein secretion system
MNKIFGEQMKNKYRLLLISVLILVLLLTACSTSSDQSSSTESSAVVNAAQSGTSLSQVNVLLVGTLKLEDTEQAVNTDQAIQLLPLWLAYRSLSSSQTAAEAEVDALLKQIESTMTAKQLQAIQAMALTSTDLMDLMQAVGGGRGSQGTPNPQVTPGFDVPSGGFPSGSLPDMPAGGPAGDSSGGTTRNFPQGGVIIQVGPGGDAGSGVDLGGGQALQVTPDPSMQATAQARFSTQASQVNSILLDVLISKLEAKTTS